MSEPNPDTARRGLMLVLSSPSGAGKTTLSRRLLEVEQGIEISVSVTTRAPRPGEIDGTDYRFIDKKSFARMREHGELLEWAEVFGSLYGTPRMPVERALEAGRDVLFDIDWQGTQQLSANAPADLVRVFILPPSAHELEQRLRTRALDTHETVAARMAKAADEISHWPEYDYVLINRDVERCLSCVRAILAAERLKRGRRQGLGDFIRRLQDEL